MLPAQPNQSLIDGIAVLQALASAGKAMGSREMARMLGLEATRVNRLLKTLSHLGIATQDAERRYTPGTAMHVLAAQAMFGSGLIRRAGPALEALRKFNHHVVMGVLWRDHVAYLYHAVPNTPVAEAMGRVGLFPATRSSLGMVLLSGLSAAQVKTNLSHPTAELGGRSLAAIAKELAKIRRQRYALVRPFQDQTAMSLSIALPRRQAAIALAGNFTDKDAPKLLAALRKAAETIEGDPKELQP